MRYESTVLYYVYLRDRRIGMIHKKVFNDRLDVYFDDKYRFMETFDKHTGRYTRSDDDTNKDPFMRSLPNLLDIGVMGTCSHGKSGLCVNAGVQCYQDGLNIEEWNMSFRDYRSIIYQCEGRIQQVALGGRGDPNKHKYFKLILEYTRLHNIIPNYTTSGLRLTDKEVELTKQYCGAVAVSWYRSQYTYKALDAFCSADITTNIHYVLSNSSIDEAIRRLENKNFFGDGFNRINAVVFLLHKPVGLGRNNEVLQYNDPRVKKFFSIIDNWDGDFKIGFDSCSIPGVLNFSKNVSLNSIDTCEGARFSAYITPDMIMTPCSFDQELKYGVSLREYTIEEIWNSEQFNAFRNKLQSSCQSCEKRYNCFGGCPLKPEIVLCDKKECNNG